MSPATIRAPRGHRNCGGTGNSKGPGVQADYGRPGRSTGSRYPLNPPFPLHGTRVGLPGFPEVGCADLTGCAPRRLSKRAKELVSPSTLASVADGLSAQQGLKGVPTRRGQLPLNSQDSATHFQRSERAAFDRALS